MTLRGFDDAVDGYHDVADQLRSYLLERARDGIQAGREATRSLDSVAEFERRRERVREEFLDSIGGLPERPDDASVETIETIERDGYAVEKVVFESLADFHVTATCYVPDGVSGTESDGRDGGDGGGEHPAVLLCGGHHPFPKADDLNQRACNDLALNGVVALVFDPFGQGERTQYPDADTHPVFHGSGVYAHSYAGQQAAYAGENVARYFLGDAQAALDYLAGRTDVDRDRIGVAGTSGGGMLTAYLALVDDRPAALAPCCWVCDREPVLRAGFPQDHEQVIFGEIPRRIGVGDLATGLAPTPLCVGAAASDFFPIEGVEAAVDRIEHVYELHDATENLEFHVADTGHAAVAEIPDVLEFLCGTLGAGDYEPHEDPALLDRETLQCTPEGSVLDASADERTVSDLVAASVTDTDADLPDSPGRGTLKDRVRGRLGLDRSGRELRPRFVERDEADGLVVEHVFFKSEYDPDVVVTGVLVSDEAGDDDERGDSTTAAGAPAVVLFEEGTAEIADRREEVAALAREHGTAFVFDPRGVGATRQRELPATWGEPDHFGVHGTEYKLAADATLLGESVFGMRVDDALRAAEFLRAQTGANEIAYLGDGVGAYHALYAAVVDDATTAVALEDAPRSFREMTTSREYPYDPRLAVYDVLDCDVPALFDALADDGVQIERPNG